MTDQLTTGEALELDRRRAQLTQKNAAELFGVPVDCYRRWERDHRRHDAPIPASPGKLARFERCWLARRRSGLSLREVSVELGLHLKWIHRAERGELNDPQINPLVLYWERKETV